MKVVLHEVLAEVSAREELQTGRTRKEDMALNFGMDNMQPTVNAVGFDKWKKGGRALK